MLTKKEKRWDKLPKTVKENHWFSIEDPFDLTHDLGRVVDQSPWDIWNEFRMPDLIEVDLDAATYRAHEVPLF